MSKAKVCFIRDEREKVDIDNISEKFRPMEVLFFGQQAG